MNPWATVAGLAAIKRSLIEAIPGWRAPAAFAVGTVDDAGDDARFPHTNTGRSAEGLAPVLLATVLGHDGSTATLDLDRADLKAAIETFAQARACTDVPHPNLEAWETVLAEIRRNPERRTVAVWVRDRGDVETSPADTALRHATGLA